MNLQEGNSSVGTNDNSQTQKSIFFNQRIQNQRKVVIKPDKPVSFKSVRVANSTAPQKVPFEESRPPPTGK